MIVWNKCLNTSLPAPNVNENLSRTDSKRNTVFMV